MDIRRRSGWGFVLADRGSVWVLLGVGGGRGAGRGLVKGRSNVFGKNRALGHWKADASPCLALDTGFGGPQGLKGTIPETGEPMDTLGIRVQMSGALPLGPSPLMNAQVR